MGKKVKIILLLLVVMNCSGFFVLLLFGIVKKGSEPIPIIATEEEAATYQYVGSELGVPWDIVMLVDAMDADENGEKSLKNYNPLLTSLQFCDLLEQKYENHRSPDDDGVMQDHWELEETVTYKACDEILGYIDLAKTTLIYTDAASVIEAITKKAEDKSDDDVRYETTLLCNQDYEAVLRDYIKIDEKYIDSIIQLYEAKYLPYLYGFMEPIEDIGDVELPPITVGDVSREELAKVAESIIGWPYMMGGKSSMKGQPSGPLDCSGFVDWVYIQCFGKGVTAGGKLPSGVAIAGTAIQYYASSEISESELKIGDLGFLYDPATLPAGKVNHVGIYIGEIKGQHAFIHCAGRYYGYEARKTGRVGISVSSGTNADIPSGGTYSPPMKACTFHYFRRPNFQFTDDE